MKRKFYPTSGTDRMTFWVGWVGVATVVGYVTTGLLLGRSLVELSPLGGVGMLVFLLNLSTTYFLQDRPPSEENQYAKVLARVGDIKNQLSALGKFLEQEQIRVAETRVIVGQLEEKKAALEPVVATREEIVGAILAAHTQRTASRAWKERLVGFALGVLASVLAAFFYGLFQN